MVDCGASRLEQAFSRCRRSGERALVAYLTAGDPDRETSLRAAANVLEAGADILELGMPFSDPMADGPTIQAACERALRSGFRIADYLEIVRRLRSRFDKPIVLFGYFNVVWSYGVERMAVDSAKAGVDGWLMVDVPAEERPEILPALRQYGLACIPLVAPTTTAERLPRALNGGGGFVYYIMFKGVTGARREVALDLAEHLQPLRAATGLPVAVGFGVADGPSARRAARDADGVVVGSSLIQALAQAATLNEGLERQAALVREIKNAVRLTVHP